jgi:hypothetical protein
VGAVIAVSLTDPAALGLPLGSWTLDRLAAYLHEESGPAVSRNRIGELVQAEGLRWRTQEAWSGERRVRATQEIDYGRRGTGHVFGAFRPATGDALTAPYPGRAIANWVDFLTPARQPGMGETVTKLVRVDRADASLLRALVEDLIDAAAGHGALLTDPEVGQIRVSMFRPRTQVPVERGGRLVPKRASARSPSLPYDEDDVVIEIDVFQCHPGQLCPAHARVEQEADHRSVSPVREGRAAADFQELGQLVVGYHRWR